jgi:hypothetical protein
LNVEKREREREREGTTKQGVKRERGRKGKIVREIKQ